MLFHVFVVNIDDEDDDEDDDEKIILTPPRPREEG